MQRAQQRNSARLNTFHFRRKVFPPDRPLARYDPTSRPISPSASAPHTPMMRPEFSNGGPYTPNGYPSSHSRTPTRDRHESTNGTSTRCTTPEEAEEDSEEVREMSLDEIINGRPEGFPGLMGVVNAYLNSLNVDIGTKCELRRYLDLIKHRAKGERFIRRCEDEADACRRPGHARRMDEVLYHEPPCVQTRLGRVGGDQL